MTRSNSDMQWPVSTLAGSEYPISYEQSGDVYLDAYAFGERVGSTSLTPAIELQSNGFGETLLMSAHVKYFDLKYTYTITKTANYRWVPDLSMDKVHIFDQLAGRVDASAGGNAATYKSYLQGLSAGAKAAAVTRVSDSVIEITPPGGAALADEDWTLKDPIGGGSFGEVWSEIEIYGGTDYDGENPQSAILSIPDTPIVGWRFTDLQDSTQAWIQTGADTLCPDGEVFEDDWYQQHRWDAFGELPDFEDYRIRLFSDDLSIDVMLTGSDCNGAGTLARLDWTGTVSHGIYQIVTTTPRWVRFYVPGPTQPTTDTADLRIRKYETIAVYDAFNP